jgi:hypothetical protein
LQGTLEPNIHGVPEIHPNACMSVGMRFIVGFPRSGLGFGFRTTQPHVQSTLFVGTSHVHDANGIAVVPWDILIAFRLFIHHISSGSMGASRDPRSRTEALGWDRSGTWKCGVGCSRVLLHTVAFVAPWLGILWKGLGSLLARFFCSVLWRLGIDLSVN